MYRGESLLHSGLIPFCFPGISQIVCAFSTRVFGNISLDVATSDSVRQRRILLPDILGVRAIAEVHQVHGTRTVFEPIPQSMEIPSAEDADGLATSCTGIALMVKTADCQPILLAHSSGKYIMAIHSGWKGNRQAYPQKAIHEFCEYYSLEPEDLWVVRGPSLGPVASEFIHFDREWGNEFLPWYDTERHTMDLWMLLRDQIIRSGVQESHVLGIDLCTYANAEYFFSYRHFRRCGGCDGRQGSFIWIRDTN